MMTQTSRVLLASFCALALLTGSACGYLDTELGLDDSAYAMTLDGTGPGGELIELEDSIYHFGGLSFSGRGISGGGSWGHGTDYRGHGSLSYSGRHLATPVLAPPHGLRLVQGEEEETSSPEDDFILNHTAIELIAREHAH